MNRFMPRISDALFLAPIPFIMLLAHIWSAWLIIVLVGLIGHWELRKIILKKREKLLSRVTRVSLLGFVLAMVVSLFSFWLAVAILLAFFLGMRKFEHHWHARDLHAGYLFISFFALLTFFLRSIPEDGLKIISLALVITVFSDSAAYFCGKMFGRHKMAPVLSPNKTWEGTIGGWVFAILGGLIFTSLFLPEIASWSLLVKVLFFGFLAFLGQIGDLFESGFKRKYKVKDSGLILRSHGGILDRFDSLAPIIMALSIMYWFF